MLIPVRKVDVVFDAATATYTTKVVSLPFHCDKMPFDTITKNVFIYFEDVKDETVCPTCGREL